MDSEILDIDAAAKCLGVSSNCIYILARKGKIPATKVGKTWRFHRGTLLDWVAGSGETSQLERILKNTKVVPGSKR